MKVTVTSVLPTNGAVVWKLLKQTSTLIYVAGGWMTYDGATDLPPTWQTGATMNLKPKLWGQPQGDHIVQVVAVNDADRIIETREHGASITKWDHTMRVMGNSSNTCLLVDTIEIEAGWRTLAIATFAWFFYRHRHRRWLQLIAHETKLMTAS